MISAAIFHSALTGVQLNGTALSIGCSASLSRGLNIAGAMILALSLFSVRKHCKVLYGVFELVSPSVEYDIAVSTPLR
jgi:hypothetical protein